MIIWGTGNLPNGGESNSIFGMIFVKYPEDSILSITGGYTLKKEISSTQRLYYIKTPGNYTITSRRVASGETISKTVSVDSYGQSISFEMFYPVWLIKNGIFSETIPHTMIGHEESTFEQAENGYVLLSAPGKSSSYTTGYFEGVDLTNYNSIVFDGQVTGYYSSSKHCPAVGVLSTIAGGSSNSTFIASEYNLLASATSKNYTERSYSVINVANDNSLSANIGFQCSGYSTNKYVGGVACYNLYLTNIG